MQYTLFIRTQYPRGDDMTVRFGELLEQVRLADRLGFSTIAAGMHYGTYPLQMLQQVPFLARIMAEVPTLRILPGIVLLSLHKPLDIAEQLATLDVMSGGRLVFGAGLGYREVEFKGFGTSQAERAARFEENLHAVIRLWTEDDVTMAGSHFELEGVNLSVKPAQKPRPPIWIAANADVAVRRAARLGDTWFINPHQRMDTIERQLDIYKKTLDDCGKPFPDELPLMRELFVAGSRAEAVRLARPHLEAKYQSYHDWGQDKAMPRGDNDLSLPFDELAEGRFLLGEPDQVAEQIVGYNKTLGVNSLVVSLQWVGMPQAQVVDAMHLFAEEVMPKVAQAI